MSNTDANVYKLQAFNVENATSSRINTCDEL